MRAPSAMTTWAGVSHMMMIEDNPAPGRHGKPTNLQVMDVLLEWTKRNIKSPKTIECLKQVVKGAHSQLRPNDKAPGRTGARQGTLRSASVLRALADQSGARLPLRSSQSGGQG